MTILYYYKPPHYVHAAYEVFISDSKRKKRERKALRKVLLLQKQRALERQYIEDEDLTLAILLAEEL